MTSVAENIVGNWRGRHNRFGRFRVIPNPCTLAQTNLEPHDLLKVEWRQNNLDLEKWFNGMLPEERITDIMHDRQKIIGEIMRHGLQNEVIDPFNKDYEQKYLIS